MRYVVDAGFHDGKPRLMVVDAVSGEIRMQWLLEKSHVPAPAEKAGNLAMPPGESHGMQSLLKDLFLIACSDDLEPRRDGDLPAPGSEADQYRPPGEIPGETYGVNNQ